jgi:hypothetical protein
VPTLALHSLSFVEYPFYEDGSLNQVVAAKAERSFFWCWRDCRISYPQLLELGDNAYDHYWSLSMDAGFGGGGGGSAR